ncbi:cyclin N-terminal domain-containing protein 1 [Polyergus mexicanus]|uniref:cyclin N-terminal domain-containing protein 1 n=1 Tax=Polyergus mexicanus TaxID=615972 RepID=UPI0038B4FFD3
MKDREQKIINKGQLIMPYDAITVPVVVAATHIMDTLGLNRHVKYMALELFDKFINKFYQEAYNMRKNGSDKWLQIIRKKTSTHAPFYLLSCFQVVCKVNSHPNSLKISQILQLAQIFVKDYEYTREMVTMMEVEVLKKVGFRMPLYTPVYCIEILIAGLNFLKITFVSEETENGEELHKASLLLLDIAYLKYEELINAYDRFQSKYVCRNARMSIQEKMQKLRILKSNTLLLSAATVLCAGYILYPYPAVRNSRLRLIVANLARLANTTDSDVMVMANMLYQLVQYKISSINVYI